MIESAIYGLIGGLVGCSIVIFAMYYAPYLIWLRKFRKQNRKESEEFMMTNKFNGHRSPPKPPPARTVESYKNAGCKDD